MRKIPLKPSPGMSIARALGPVVPREIGFEDEQDETGGSSPHPTRHPTLSHWLCVDTLVVKCISIIRENSLTSFAGSTSSLRRRTKGARQTQGVVTAINLRQGQSDRTPHVTMEFPDVVFVCVCVYVCAPDNACQSEEMGGAVGAAAKRGSCCSRGCGSQRRIVQRSSQTGAAAP